MPLLVLLRQPSSGLLAACLSCCVSLKSSRRRRNQASVTWTGATPLLANTTWVLRLVGCNASLMRACTRSSVWYSHTFSLFHTHTHTHSSLPLPPSPSLVQDRSLREQGCGACGATAVDASGVGVRIGFCAVFTDSGRPVLVFGFAFCVLRPALTASRRATCSSEGTTSFARGKGAMRACEACVCALSSLAHAHTRTRTQLTCPFLLVLCTGASSR